MYKLVGADANEVIDAVPDGIDYGTYNTLPQPFMEITESDYIQRIGSQTMRYTEFRQVYEDGFSHHLNTRIEWYHDIAIAIVFPTEWSSDSTLKFGIRFKQPLRYFYIGCDHKWKELSAEKARKAGVPHYGMCYHVYYCDDCGRTMASDSSD